MHAANSRVMNGNISMTVKLWTHIKYMNKKGQQNSFGMARKLQTVWHLESLTRVTQNGRLLEMTDALQGCRMWLRDN